MDDDKKQYSSADNNSDNKPKTVIRSQKYYQTNTKNKDNPTKEPAEQTPQESESEFRVNRDNLKADNDIYSMFGITEQELRELLAFRADKEKQTEFWIYTVGILFMPISLAGALIGYVRGYNRFMRPKLLLPKFYPMRPIVRIAMVIGAIISWVAMAVFCLFILGLVSLGGYEAYFFYSYFLFNVPISLIVIFIFKRWQTGANNVVVESEKFGSARFARKDELFTLENKQGYYIGQGHLFNDFGHILTVAGTRGGKGTNIIIPNLLDAGNIETSWIVIDPKGENAAITAKYQRSKGQNVVVLNPWGLLENHIGESQTYNPLDMLDITSIHFVDDIQVIAEMIVPVEKAAKDPFWTDAARTVVVGLLLFIMTDKPKGEQSLGTLWELSRLSGDDWDELVKDMGSSMHPEHKKLVRNSANEILKLSAASDETFGGIMASVLQATDFLKSPAMQYNLTTGFDPATLADGKTTLYVIIPADKLKTHYRWMRLVVTSLMRAVIRKPKKRVTFLLDEFAALGYMSEIEVALSTYAGYNVTVWPILQTLVQLESLYDKNWQTFISNCTVRQFFSINDMFSASYISEAVGHTSHISATKAWFGVKDAEASQRLLITPDELRRESGKRIFMFIADLPPTFIDKLPYYKVPDLQQRADKNPYI